MKKLLVVAAAIMILVCGSLWLKDREAQQQAQEAQQRAQAQEEAQEKAFFNPPKLPMTSGEGFTGIPGNGKQ